MNDNHQVDKHFHYQVLDSINRMWNKYLGQIEIGNEKVIVYANDKGYLLTIYSNDKRVDCQLLDTEHTARELEHRGYSQSFIDVILSML